MGASGEMVGRDVVGLRVGRGVLPPLPSGRSGTSILSVLSSFPPLMVLSLPILQSLPLQLLLPSLPLVVPVSALFAIMTWG